MWVERPGGRRVNYNRSPEVLKKIIGSGSGSKLREVKIGHFRGLVKSCNELHAAIDSIKFYQIFRMLGLPVPILSDLSERGEYLVKIMDQIFFIKKVMLR